MCVRYLVSLFVREMTAKNAPIPKDDSCTEWPSIKCAITNSIFAFENCMPFTYMIKCVDIHMYMHTYNKHQQ